MTRRDIIDRFHDLMDSYNRVYWNDTRATALLNTVKDRLAQEFAVNRVEQYYEFDSVQGQQHYEVPSTLVVHRYMYYNSGHNKVISFADGPESIYGPAANQTMQGTPSQAYIWGVSGRRQFTIYPTFNISGMLVRWWFYGWCPDVVVDNDEPALPLEWHPSIIEIMVGEQQAFDKYISIADKYVIWTNCIQRLKRLDVTKQLTSLGGKSGSIDAHFPRIPSGGDSPVSFNIQFPGGGVTPG